MFAGSALAQDDDPVIVNVDGRTETLSGFNERFEIAIRGLVASMGMPMSEDLRGQLEGLKPEYLDQLASDLALLNEAERQGIVVTDEEVDEQVAASLAGIPEEELGAVLASAGFSSVEQLAVLVRETETIQRYLDSMFEQMEFSEEELSAWWDENSAQFASGEQVCAAHILVDDLEVAEGLLQEIEAGADFAELAREHSTDPGSGQAGGELGCFGRGMMVAPFEEAAFGAEEGDVVGPVESQFGQHVILVNSRIPAGEADFEAYREQAEIAIANERIADIIAALVDVAEIETRPELLAAETEPAVQDAPAEESQEQDPTGDDAEEAE